jgi:tRNA nucleotidyltransferase (CCA-adding enzyme)
MANCSDDFLRFNNSISLSRTDRKFLRSARNSVTKKIKKYFSENTECSKIEFMGQGSFSMGTIVKPVNGDYDIDVGVYLRGYSNYRNNWPKCKLRCYNSIFLKLQYLMNWRFQSIA